MARPEFKPTPAQRRQVSILAAAKVSEVDIAAALDIARGTLRKHFAQELKTGKSKRNAAVIQAIYKQALSGNVSAQRLWVKVAGLDVPSFPNFGDEPEEKPVKTTKPKSVGKKQAAQEAAVTAGTGTEWGDDLAFNGRVN
ncbi:hypothetical protein [Azospirillum tabaci]|uniref:hypothetical protein n=1 Tax=Azospirillum tabaci TaxID=2752310 RepID=UPI0016613F4D|nr:hypothetical protein [Azospirillum tabaci]